jgi:enterochelin esterase-like enzyme
MKVVDKFRPISLETERWTTPWKAIVAAWAMLGFLALFHGEALYTEAQHTEDNPTFVAAAELNHAVSSTLGITAVRGVADLLNEPLVEAPRILVAPEEAPPAPVAPAPPPPVPESHWRGFEGRTTRVLIVGASSIQSHIGSELERSLEAEYAIVVHREGRLGTSLVRNDVFDWSARILALMDEHSPDTVILNFGGNDAQPVLTPDGKKAAFGTDEWNAEFERRVAEVTTNIIERRATPVWIGTPVMRTARFSERQERLTELVRKASLAAGGRYVPMADLSSTTKGLYRADITFNGSHGLMRMADGVHFTRLGAQYVVHHMLPRLERELLLISADESLGVALRRDIPPATRDELTSYVAYVPRDGQRAPMLLLLHGAWGGWTDWSEHAHRELLALAEEHDVVIVTPDGASQGWYLDSPAQPSHRFASYIMDDVLAHARLELPVEGPTSIAGLSMGGHGALVLASRHPGEFTSVSSMSGVVSLEPIKEREVLVDLLGPWEPTTWGAWSAHHRVAADPTTFGDTPLLIEVGADDKWAAANREFDLRLTELGVAHRFEQHEGYGHSWDFWTNRLPVHVAFHATHLH